MVLKISVKTCRYFRYVLIDFAWYHPDAGNFITAGIDIEDIPVHHHIFHLSKWANEINSFQIGCYILDK